MNVASALLFINGLVGVFYGLQELFLLAPLTEEMLGVTTSEVSALSQDLLDFIRLQTRFVGLYLLCFGLVFCVISLISLRKGEKWAWYTVTATAGIGLLGQLVGFYIGLPSYVALAIGLVILWIVGIALSAKEIFS